MLRQAVDPKHVAPIGLSQTSFGISIFGFPMWRRSITNSSAEVLRSITGCATNVWLSRIRNSGFGRTRYWIWSGDQPTRLKKPAWSPDSAIISIHLPDWILPLHPPCVDVAFRNGQAPKLDSSCIGDRADFNGPSLLRHRVFCLRAASRPLR